MSDVPGGPTPPPLLRHLPLPRWADRKGRIPPKTLGEILSAAFNLYKANAASLILIVAIVVVPLTFISSLFSERRVRRDEAHGDHPGATGGSGRAGASGSSWRARSSPR